jgi:hypothetical protein
VDVHITELTEREKYEARQREEKFSCCCCYLSFVVGMSLAFTLGYWIAHHLFVWRH